MSQKDLGVLLGVTEDNIGTYEKRGTKPKDHLIHELAGIFGIEYAHLLTTPLKGIIIVILSTSKSHRINQIEEQKRQTELLQTMANGQFSVAAEIEKLKQLLDRGAITQEEFDSQKGKLLQKV